MRHPPVATLFPYTTLFRSLPAQRDGLLELELHRPHGQVGEPLGPLELLAVALDLLVVPVVVGVAARGPLLLAGQRDRKSTRLNSSHRCISYAVFCLHKKN